jgi:alkanesulfonate monooxygenase SsuD/methylene tetrahydromethanopterin reductase-like flavin-dependent oxidoreductase (luciferase family)
VERALKFAVFSLMQWPEDRAEGDVYHDELEQLVLAEAQGFDAAWLAEHHFSRYGIEPSIHLTAAHLAARTRRIRIGTAVTVLPFFHPLRAAEEVAMLDHLSGGRLDWGVGRGYQGHEFAGFGVDIATSHLLFREQLEIVRRAWTGEPFAFEGQFHRFPELRVLPTPVQRPHPPLFIAALSPETVAWAADHAYPVLTDQFSPVHRIEESRRTWRERAARAGLDPASVALPTLRQVYVGETFAKAREEAAPALLWYYRALARVGSPGGPSGRLPENYAFYRIFGEERLDPDRDRDAFLAYLFEHCAIVGDEAYCREKLREHRERYGLDYLIAWQNFGDLPHAATLASQRRFIEKVAPAFA